MKPLVDLLAVSDAKIIGVALEALENILKAGIPLRSAMKVWQHMATILMAAIYVFFDGKILGIRWG